MNDTQQDQIKVLTELINRYKIKINSHTTLVKNYTRDIKTLRESIDDVEGLIIEVKSSH